MAMGAFVGSLRGAQIRGTLEPLLLTKARLPELFIGWSLYPIIKSSIFFIVFLIGAFLMIGVDLSGANFGVAFSVLLLIVIVLGNFGLLAASFTLVFKQSDPFTRGMLLAAGFLSGAAFPVTLLPGWLQAVGKALPQTHALEATRLAVLQGASFSELAGSVGALLIYAGALLPLSVWTFARAMRRAKMDGSLAHY
jgi:ABC-2 type transport system permease protein